ncbi:phage tail length tape measure family protein [Sagittula sp. S175]|uniref:phage tail length tape measure family protein n=1 Tax=Sagittula sp. S175 TaxID=3415129 RepID=UPI003C7D73AF
MALRLHGRITADGKQAQAELRRTTAETDRLGDAAERMGRQGRDAGRALSGAAEDSGRLAQQNQLAAGSVGNLTAQFNDIGVMLMAGQNPLQLAIQQGTQITQVIGPMGAAQAVKALGSAFMGMLSPVSLITIGAIAAGAAVTQWLTGSAEEAKSFEDRIVEVSDEISTYRERADLAGATTEELEKRFKAAAPAARAFFAEFSDTSLRGMQQGMQAAIQQLLDETELDVPKWDVGDQQTMAELFNVPLLGLGKSVRDGRRAINEVLASYAQLSDAAQGTTDDQIAAARRLREALVAGAELTGGITSAENERIAQVEALIERLLEVRGQEPDPEREAAKARAAWANYYRSRVLGERQLAETTRQQQMAQAYGPYQASRAASDAALKGAQEMLVTLQDENALRELALTYGEDSVQVLDAQQAAQRAVFEETLGTLDVSESLKEELRRAFEEKLALANVDVASGIWEAANAASQLAANLAAARAQGIADLQQAQIAWDYRNDPVGKAGAIAGAQFDMRMGDTSGVDPILQQGLERQRTEYVANAEAVETLRQKTAEYAKEQAKLGRATGGGKGGRKGGKSRTRQERDEVAELLRDYDQRLAILRETDPVQQELLRHSEALTKATQAQVDAVREKIAAMQTERAQQERINDLQSFSGSLVKDGLAAMRAKGEEAYQVWNRLGDKILSVIEDAAIMGTGPAAGLFGRGLIPTLFGSLTGGGGGGGLFSLFGKLPGRADGGMTYGPGGSRDDLILGWSTASGPYRKSPGEFVVNAHATARHRALLEAINSNAPLPFFANGGAVAGGGASGWGPAQVSFVVNNNGEPMEAHDDGTDAQGRRLFRLETADAVGGAMQTRGGTAARWAKQHKLGPRGPRR